MLEMKPPSSEGLALGCAVLLTVLQQHFPQVMLLFLQREETRPGAQLTVLLQSPVLPNTDGLSPSWAHCLSALLNTDSLRCSSKFCPPLLFRAESC